MQNTIVNPLFYYFLSFIVVLLFYNLGWSGLYPQLSFELTLFIFFTLFICFFGIFFINLIIKKFKNFEIPKVSKNKVYYLLLFLTVSLILECLYHGVVPIFLVFKGIEYDYTKFGIPVFHVFLLSYITILGLIYFYRFLIYKNIYYLSIYAFSLIFSIIIVNRGTLIFILVSSLIAYLSLRINLNKIVKVSFFVLLVAILFGYMGNLRMVSSGYSDNHAILKIGQASPEFINTKLPSEFFWSYLYISSPYANLEYEVSKRKINNNYDFESFFIYEMLPDFVYKRINTGLNKSNLLTEELNVSTLYGGSINKMGFLGAFIIFFWYIFSLLFTIFIVNKKYFMPTIISLATLSCFLLFDNVLSFTGFVFQYFILMIFSHFNFRQITIL